MQNQEYYDSIQNDARTRDEYFDTLKETSREFLISIEKAENGVDEWMIGWNYIYQFTKECFPEDTGASEMELKLITKAVLREAKRIVPYKFVAPLVLHVVKLIINELMTASDDKEFGHTDDFEMRVEFDDDDATEMMKYTIELLNITNRYNIPTY